MKLRFSIRAVIVLTALFAIWLTYSMNWIRQRRELYDSPIITGRGHYTRAPGLLFLLGEPGYSDLHVDFEEGDREINRIRAIFPESQCHGYDTISVE
ncbi:MAG: hypothetical protein JNL18_01705 [Planctomycetaceae bacterium]|nr:hypothetical protein [Planctomycetaceae bacterium]